MPESLAERAVVRIAKSRHIDRFAVRALLRANELLGLALGVRLAKLRDLSSTCLRECRSRSRSSILSPRRCKYRLLFDTRLNGSVPRSISFLNRVHSLLPTVSLLCFAALGHTIVSVLLEAPVPSRSLRDSGEL
jgi:hypothetical protein